MGDYYEILGVAGDATADDIKKAYRRLALQWHPDKNPNNIEEASQKFKRIAEAYEILSDPSRRHAYDTRGQTSTPREHTTQPHFGSQDFRSAAEIFEFHFRPAEEIFRDFFRDNPFQDFFEQSMPPFFAFPPGLESLAASAFSGLRDYETSDRRRRNGQGTQSPRADRSRGTNRGHFTAMSASTKIVNGKSVTTRRSEFSDREVENGVETTSVYEDGVLRSRTVRGPNQSKSSLRGPI